MARPARHKIELSEEERGELVRIARAEKLPLARGAARVEGLKDKPHAGHARAVSPRSRSPRSR